MTSSLSIVPSRMPGRQDKRKEEERREEERREQSIVNIIIERSRHHSSDNRAGGKVEGVEGESVTVYGHLWDGMGVTFLDPSVDGDVVC